jgi:membrane associated rhomboid family serine protease
VEPFFCYLLIAIQLSVYAAGTGLGVTAGPEAAQDWALTLSLSPETLHSHPGEWLHLFTTQLLHSGLPHLTLDTFMLGYFASEAEAMLGHWVFLSIYLLSGLSGSVTTVLWGSAEPTAGATTAMLGVVGAMIGYELRNKAVLQQQQRGRKEVLASDAPFSGMKQRGWISRPIAGLGLLGVTLVLGMLPEGIPSDNAGHLGGIAAGVVLGYLLGPKLVMTREVEIPVGSMMVPEDADETIVVVDQSGLIERLVVGVTYVGLLAGIVSKAI